MSFFYLKIIWFIQFCPLTLKTIFLVTTRIHYYRIINLSMSFEKLKIIGLEIQSSVYLEAPPVVISPTYYIPLRINTKIINNHLIDLAILFKLSKELHITPNSHMNLRSIKNFKSDLGAFNLVGYKPMYLIPLNSQLFFSLAVNFIK